MKNDALNPQVFLETTCYVTFAAVMLYLALSGKYLTYIAPRMKPYLYFSAAVMLVWSFFNLRRMYRPQHIVRSRHCLVLGVPILLLLLPPRPLDASSISAAYVGGRCPLPPPPPPPLWRKMKMLPRIQQRRAALSRKCQRGFPVWMWQPGVLISLTTRFTSAFPSCI